LNIQESESDLDRVEYDLDDDDVEWIQGPGANLKVSEDEFEYIIDQFEKQLGFRPVR
jgi:hypothetical protein